MILNASGCLDALAAPDVARQLDAFVTKTITPEPRGSESPQTALDRLASHTLWGPPLGMLLANRDVRTGRAIVPEGLAIGEHDD